MDFDLALFLIFAIVIIVLAICLIIYAIKKMKKPKEEVFSETFIVKSGNKVNVTVKSTGDNKTEIKFEQSSDL